MFRDIRAIFFLMILSISAWLIFEKTNPTCCVATLYIRVPAIFPITAIFPIKLSPTPLKRTPVWEVAPDATGVPASA
jgi:hypothetical protein